MRGSGGSAVLDEKPWGVDHDGLASRDDRNADPDWQADWQRGHEIGSLIVVGLALVMAIVSVLLGGWETPVVAELYPEWPS